MSNSTNPFDEAVASDSRSNSKLVLWLKHGAYSFTLFVWEYFTGPRKPKQPKSKDSQFKFIAERLITTLPDNPDQLTVDTTKQLLEQHRTIENTQARRRLERWACWAIVIYLACVFLLLIFNGVSRVLWPNIFTSDKPLFSDNVLYVILSTTTVNILGLGFIVLKGHFPQKEDKSHSDSTEG
ncbi:hypothetical protein [uncultured Duncaniella sp.]|uniref:hypothetical protein n=1 Tax=uncultured Duncaniella sp. TaxID=2768039 RepID=UPI0025AA28C8|nr:hypothetical protein [uncultured Duncaniella sp.]